MLKVTPISDIAYIQSMSFFLLKPVIFSTYAVTFHSADVIAYNGRLNEWLLLEDKVESGFSGPSVARSVTSLQKYYPPFRNFRLNGNESQVLTIPKIGAFSASLTSEFTIKIKRNDASYSEEYVALGLMLHINSRYLMCTCFVPDVSHSEVPAYFLGDAEISDVHDTSRLKAISSARLNDWYGLTDPERAAALSERVQIKGKIT